ncbi:uncharacterized protein LOC135076618 [Ostrinia nubilalis]|uniref:uncharacterized protein LOC135076618 n=1 Tax=Ostrinia nubilalis TaxID=29057 RepID=UPI0030826762
MAVGKITEFDLDCGNWQLYAERLEMYFKVNGISEEMKLPTLITTMGDRAYELLTNLASPRKPADMTFKENVLCSGKGNKRRMKIFWGMWRYSKKLSKNCEFRANLEENLRDQFICGIRDDGIRQQLFAKNQITFKESVAIAVSFESAVRDAAVVEAAADGASAGGRAAAGAYSTDAFSGSRSRLSAGRPSSVGGEDAINNLQIGGCFACGDYRHRRNECKFKEYECSRCKKVGHLRRMCPENSKTAAARFGGKNEGSRVAHRGNRGAAQSRGSRTPASTRAHYLEDARETAERDEEEEEPMYQMSLSSYKPI